jgi:hypothetical protein
MSYRWLDHTSELALHVDAPSGKAVFEQALVAFGELIEGYGEGDGNGENGAARRLNADGESWSRELTVAADDRAALLATFQEELVYLARRTVLCRSGPRASSSPADARLRRCVAIAAARGTWSRA